MSNFFSPQIFVLFSTLVSHIIIIIIIEQRTENYFKFNKHLIVQKYNLLCPVIKTMYANIIYSLNLY